MEAESMSETFDAEAIAALNAVVAEAQAYNTDMEERGYHTGGPPDIEGIYDSRTWLLAEGAKRLLAERAKVKALAEQYRCTTTARDDDHLRAELACEIHAILGGDK